MVLVTRMDHKSWVPRAAVAVVCALLVVLAGALQVAHIHPVQAVSHADCSLCVVAHVTLDAGQQPMHPAPSAVATAVEMLSLESDPTASSEFALFTRPPPAQVGIAA